MIQEPTNSLGLTEFQNIAVSHTILPALNNISPTTDNFIQTALIEIPPVSHTNLPGQNISPTTHNLVQSAPIEFPPVTHTISQPCIHKSNSTQGTYIETIKRLADKQDEQTESHSQCIESKVNPGPPDVCLKRKLEHTDLEVYSVKAIHAQRKRRGIQQYLVEWEGYTMKEATWEPKRKSPEKIINSLWGNKTHSINKE
ncbi:hypothetical protein CHS0354_040413 [Potamilus streckersoni]|uniref:Chromo domain-containing protein n=1 Tax=Potamilus streckersoni TaxID=2493646 RepID=A0AAE0W5Q6_9BIVA|nr:hypothetical protein CHS0354_040413 [Potamilus streckersoni]